jgi:hypothetical protein
VIADISLLSGFIQDPHRGLVVLTEKETPTSIKGTSEKRDWMSLAI